MNKPVIAVFGATGAQGGSVVQHLVETHDFQVRALTRRPADYDGPAHEAAFADLDEPASLEAALRGASGMFLVTDFWRPGTDELAQATAAVAAARAAGVRHVVWSSLPDVEAISGGAWHVPHFTGKARVEPIIREAGFPTFTFVQPPFYFENLLSMMGPQPLPDGRKGWALPIDPDARVIHMGSVAEFGKLVAGVFAQPEATHGATLSMAAGRYGFSDVVSAYAQALGEELVFLQVPHEVFAGFFPQAGEIGQMLGYFESHTYMGPDSDARIDQGRAIATGSFTPLEAFLTRHLQSTGA